MPSASHVPPVVDLPVVDSTNDEVRRRLDAGDPTPIVVCAGMQTMGRGTRGRAWDSPDGGGLYLSLGLRDGEPPMLGDGSIPTTLHTLAAGVAVAQALRDTYDVDARLKPVNDVMVDGRKLGGILAETVVVAGSLESLVIGVGVNLAAGERMVRPDGVPSVSVAELDPSAAVEDQAARRDLARTVAGRLLEWATRACHGERDSIEAAWTGLAVPGAAWPG